MSSAVVEARRLSRKAGRGEITDLDIVTAIEDYRIPTDENVAVFNDAPGARALKRRGRPPATPVQEALPEPTQTAATRETSPKLPTPGSRTTTAKLGFAPA